MFSTLRGNIRVELDQGYASLMKNYYGIHPLTGLPVDPKKNTKGTNQFKSAQTLFDTSARLADTKSLLDEAMDTMSNPKSSKTSFKKAIKLIQKTIIPMLDIAVDTTSNAASIAAPIASSKVAHKREEVKRKREVQNEHPDKNPAAVMVENYIKINGSPETPHPKRKNVEKPVQKTTSARSAKKPKGRQLPMNTTTLPVPKNGHTYGIGEAVGIAIQSPWNFKGRRPLLTDEECAECAETGMSYNDNTLNNYFAQFAMRAGLSLEKSSNAKTNNRWIAEHSIINAMSYIIVIAMTHFYIVEEEDPEWRELLRKLIFNCDDETSYICEGIQPKQGSEYGLVPTSSLGRRGTDSIYHQEDSNRMNGRRVKNHFMKNALGDSAPAVIAITGMSERELPKDKFIPLKFEGLCVGGYGVGGSKKPGYVLLMRGYPGAEIDRFDWLRDNIHFPHINDCRETYEEYDTRLGAPSGERLKAILRPITISRGPSNRNSSSCTRKVG
mmetsp:Transcript_13645/g.23958  ORF Transcript_13645/g.23958 Transcript_13645/m.23958 type:complete len:497 (+) Transcript_13645:87-1577(+)